MSHGAHPTLGTTTPSPVGANNLMELAVSWSDSLKEVEARVKAMDKWPSSLDLLRKAIEMIAAARSVDLSVTVETGRLIVTHGAEKLSIWVDGGVYVAMGQFATDTVITRYADLELLAWRATGTWFLPRHVSAAAERVRREGGDESKIPLRLLSQEQQKEYLYEDGLIKRLETPVDACPRPSAPPTGPTIMTTQTPDILEISYSPVKMLVVFAGGLLMTGLSAAIALRSIPGVAAGSRNEFLGYAGTIVFSICTGMALWKLLTMRGPIVIITPDGIRDTRIAAEFIPWTFVRQISTWELHRQKVMVLSVDPAIEKKLTLTRIARWSRGPNRTLGADGLCIAAQGLKIKYDTLFRTSLSYAGMASGGRSLANASEPARPGRLGR